MMIRLGQANRVHASFPLVSRWVSVRPVLDLFGVQGRSSFSMLSLFGSCSLGSGSNSDSDSSNSSKNESSVPLTDASASPSDSSSDTPKKKKKSTKAMKEDASSSSSSTSSTDVTSASSEGETKSKKVKKVKEVGDETKPVKEKKVKPAKDTLVSSSADSANSDSVTKDSEDEVKPVKEKKVKEKKEKVAKEKKEKVVKEKKVPTDAGDQTDGKEVKEKKVKEKKGKKVSGEETEGNTASPSSPPVPTYPRMYLVGYKPRRFLPSPRWTVPRAGAERPHDPRSMDPMSRARPPTHLPIPHGGLWNEILRRATMSKTRQDKEIGPVARVPWVRSPSVWTLWDFTRRMGRDHGVASLINDRRRVSHPSSHPSSRREITRAIDLRRRTPLQRRRGQRGFGDVLQARVLEHVLRFWSSLTRSERRVLPTMKWLNAEFWVVPRRMFLRVVRLRMYFEVTRGHALSDAKAFRRSVIRHGGPNDAMSSVSKEQRIRRRKAEERLEKERSAVISRRTKVAHRRLILETEMLMCALDPLVRLRRSVSEGLSTWFTNIPTRYPDIEDYGTHAPTIERRARAYEKAHVRLRKETWKRLHVERHPLITEYERLRGAGAPTWWLHQPNLVDFDTSWVNNRGVLDLKDPVIQRQVDELGRRSRDRVSEIHPGDPEYTPSSAVKIPLTEEQEIARWLENQRRRGPGPDEMTTGMDPRLSLEQAVLHLRVLPPKERLRLLRRSIRCGIGLRWVSKEEIESPLGRRRWFLRMSLSPWVSGWWGGYSLAMVVPVKTSLGLFEETRVRDVMSMRPKPPKKSKKVIDPTVKPASESKEEVKKDSGD